MIGKLTIILLEFFKQIGNRPFLALSLVPRPPLFQVALLENVKILLTETAESGGRGDGEVKKNEFD